MEISRSRVEHSANLEKVAGGIRLEFAGYAANFDRAVSGLREEFVGMSQQLSQQVSVALNIFARQPQASLSTDFPPRAASTPILSSPRARNGFNDPREARGEAEDDLMIRGGGYNHSNLQGPRMDIPLFERDQPRWWVRRCERVFYQYRVAERDKVNMAAAYLDDVADAWF